MAQTRGNRLGFCGLLLAAGLISSVGCKGGLPTMGPISLQTPGRVQPPGTGSYTVPASYSPKQGLVPVNTNGTQLPSTKSSTSLNSIQSDNGWHAPDLIQEGVKQASATVNAAQASFDRMASRLTDTPAQDSSNQSEPSATRDPAVRNATWKSIDR